MTRILDHDKKHAHDDGSVKHAEKTTKKRTSHAHKLKKVRDLLSCRRGDRVKHGFTIVLAVIMVLMIVTYVSEGVMTDGAAVATRIEGTAVIFATDAPAGRPLMKNDSIAKNDRVEVQGNSRLELRLPDGGYVRLSENARLTMRMLQFEKRTSGMYLQTILHNGKVWVKVHQHATSDARVDVITNAGLASGKGTVYGVDAGEDASMISVYDGEVLATSAPKIPPPADGQTSAPAEAPQISVRTMQQTVVSARDGVSQPREFDLKSTINDWSRWNLQRDAREGLASLTIAPAASTVSKGASLQLAAIAHYPDNVERDVASFATWSTSDVAIAKIDPFGNAAGVEIGAARIAAAIEEVGGSTMLNVNRDIVSIKVAPVAKSIMNGAAQQFTAMGTFSDKAIRDITSTVVWSSSDTNIAFVDATGRTVAGNKAGTALITASQGGVRGSVELKVRRELVSLKIMPEDATIIPGDTQKFGAIGSFSDKTTEDLTDVVKWKTSNSRIAVMDQVQPGRVLGQKPGDAAITVTYKKKSAAATITVEIIQEP